ncbi:transglycosylase-like protein with SLT domain [Modicisalibacter xianhensis]|uniref:Transglycosylase-like protein with SLT domain n=2 Tax=Modicisalibacter xianhensis TaxID=442341 RepID=A0A4R8FKX9_9GAMM|nr:transglycosylase-like protein with SLT domain [Halomonas xianhensis]
MSETCEQCFSLKPEQFAAQKKHIGVVGKKITKAVLKSAIASLAITVQSALANPLAGTLFDTTGTEIGVDPLLLYSVALAESANGPGHGSVSPWPWTVRALDQAIYASSKEEAKVQLERLLNESPSVDVGMMQVNTRWNGHRVSHPSELLEPAKALEIGGEILLEAINSAPGDLELGIGRYHTWADEAVARNYGQRILAIYRNIKAAFGDDGGRP